MNASRPITITPIFVADLLVEGERMPVYVHVIDHPDARILVDTGMTELHPMAADLNPCLHPLNKQNFDLGSVDIVVNTHLHADHCGGNHLFAGKPIYVQRRELDDARSNKDAYPIREWIDAAGVEWMASSSCFPGCGSSPRRVTQTGCRSSSWTLENARSWSAATLLSGSANSRSRTAKANCAYWR